MSASCASTRPSRACATTGSRHERTSFAGGQPLPACGERSPRSCAAGEGDSEFARDVEAARLSAYSAYRNERDSQPARRVEGPPHPLASKTMRATSPRKRGEVGAAAFSESDRISANLL